LEVLHPEMVVPKTAELLENFSTPWGARNGVKAYNDSICIPAKRSILAVRSEVKLELMVGQFSGPIVAVLPKDRLMQARTYEERCHDLNFEWERYATSVYNYFRQHISVRGIA
jgi:hypothetical protein